MMFLSSRKCSRNFVSRSRSEQSAHLGLGTESRDVVSFRQRKLHDCSYISQHHKSVPPAPCKSSISSSLYPANSITYYHSVSDNCTLIITIILFISTLQQSAGYQQPTPLIPRSYHIIRHHGKSSTHQRYQWHQTGDFPLHLRIGW